MGALQLANRIVMAPVTRSRMADDGVPNELHATYYAQRASAGLIIAEATNISAQGRGYAMTPGIWSEEQVAGWKKSPTQYTRRAAKLSVSYGTWGVFPVSSCNPTAKRR